MSDERTQEQRDAEKALDAAIRRVYDAYDGEMLLTEWVVAFAHVGADEESEFSAVDLHTGPANPPLHHVEGLLQRGLRRLDQFALEGEDEN